MSPLSIVIGRDVKTVVTSWSWNNFCRREGIPNKGILQWHHRFGTIRNFCVLYPAEPNGLPPTFRSACFNFALQCTFTLSFYALVKKTSAQIVSWVIFFFFEKTWIGEKLSPGNNDTIRTEMKGEYSHNSQCSHNLWGRCWYQPFILSRMIWVLLMVTIHHTWVIALKSSNLKAYW